jgi:hypothetical protein
MTTTPAVRSMIGTPLDAGAETAAGVAYARPRSVGALGQAALLALVGLGLGLTGLPSFIPGVAFALAGLIAAGAILDGLRVLELAIDPTTHRYRVRRGIAPFTTTIEGELDDFHGVGTLLDPYGGWHLGLQPRGSGRIYGLEHADDLDDARPRGEALARRFGVPWVPPEAPDEPAAAPARVAPPAERRLGERASRHGREIVFPRRLLWVEFLVIGAHELRHGVRWRIWDREFGETVTALRWPTVSEITVSPITRSRARPFWRLRPDWRALADAHWRWLCHELGRPPRPAPWWWGVWFIASEFPFETHKALTIRCYGQRAVQLGDDALVPRAELDALAAELCEAWRRAGGG